ncbi:MAG TPA: RNA methyltransferase [Blastocatellia bacterium]|nr:RNA methyltransferase [Blastocatellia bacterium]
MLTERITSPQNPLIKRFRAVRDGRERHILFVEGARAVEEAFKANLGIESVIFSDEFITTEHGAAIKAMIESCHCRGASVPSKLLEAVCDTVTPQGIALIARQPYYSVDDVLGNGELVVAADQLQDPGNIGTIVRTAAAVSSAGLITFRGTVDPFGAKALRASMGAAFRLPIATDAVISDVCEKAKLARFTIVATAASGNILYNDYDWKSPSVLLIGNEGEGLSDESLKRADVVVRLPLSGSVESLNVASAAAVILYEAVRQNNFKNIK